MIPGFSRNCRRTSCTTVPAVRPTARMASDENRNTTVPPMSAPAKVLGSAMLIDTASNAAATSSSRTALPTSVMAVDAIVSRNDANRATAAMTADPMAKPLVTALVVLPTVSRPSRIRSVSPSSSPDISAMPWALSAIGPKVSSATTIPVVDSMPMPVRATM